MFRAPVYTCAETSPTEKLSDVLAVGNAHARHSDANTFLFLSFLVILCFSFYHLLLCYSLSLPSITFSFCVSLCYSAFIHFITFSYVILCFFNHSITFSFCLSLCYSCFFLLYHLLLCYSFFLSFYHSLFLCFLMLFFISSFYHLLLCYSLFFLSFYHSLFLYFLMLFIVSSFYHLLLCYSLFFIILSLPLFVFPYVILYFFLLSPSLMLFFVYIVLSFSLRTTSSSAPEITSPNIAMLQPRAFILAKHAKTRQNTPKDHTSIWNVLELAFLPVMRSCPW